MVMKIFFKILAGLVISAAATRYAYMQGERTDALLIFAVLAVTTTLSVFWGASISRRIDARRVR